MPNEHGDKEDEMSKHIADVMVHVDENLNEELLHAVEDEIRSDSGVVSVGHNPGKRHLLMVAYDSEAVHPATFVQQLRERGLHAELVGL
jgi:hypothetical protein